MISRRMILKALGGAAAIPAVGVDAASKTLGIPRVVSEPTGELAPSPISETWTDPTGPYMGYWGSPLQIMDDARREARHDMARGNAYPHMKSWGRGFREMQTTRDAYIRGQWRQYMENDDFRHKLFRKLGIMK